MANPQLNNGYVRIANELLDAICRLNISGNEMRILLFIIRKTYGYNKKSAEISLLDISNFFEMKKNNVSRALKKLQNLNLIEIEPCRGIKPQTISVVKNYDLWSPEGYQNQQLSKLITVIKNDNSTVIKNDNSTVIKNDNHTYKDNNKDSYKDSSKDRATSKKSYGRYQNVTLSDNEYDILVDDYGDKVIDNYIDKLDVWMQSKNAKNINCDIELKKWLAGDGVQKRDKSMDKYNFVINQF